MFSVGQKVWHRNGQRSGTVLEVDGDTVYIAQENGAELDFPTSELTAAPPVVGQTPGERLRDRVAAGPGHKAPISPLSAGEMTLEHARVLAVVPQRTLRAVAALFDRKLPTVRFSALPVVDKPVEAETAGGLRACSVGSGRATACAVSSLAKAMPFRSSTSLPAIRR